MNIDLNCDLGEGVGDEAQLLSKITSANVSCGFHAGGPDVAIATLLAAGRLRVSAGAHPGFDDRDHFGRRELTLNETEVLHLMVYQIGALIGLARLSDCPIRYIKPHGALYNLACRSDSFALPIVAAAEFFGLPILALPDSRLEHLCTNRCAFVAEGFADRRYRTDGSLVPRDQPNAMILDPMEAVTQAEWLISKRGVRSLCVHGDNSQAPAFVGALREALLNRGFTILAFA